MRVPASQPSASSSPGAAERDDRAHKLVLVQPRRTERGSASEAIHVLIAGRDGLARAGLDALLNLEADIVVVGAGAVGQHALALARQLRPEVLLIDIRSPAIDAVQLTRQSTADANTSAEGEAVLSAPVARHVIADSAAKHARAVLYNGLGRYEDALAAARQATEHPEDLAVFTSGLVELIEAAARSGKSELAAEALGRLSQTATASSTDCARGLEARSRALLSDGETAETLYREAIELLGRTHMRMELARAYLLYGEWLRRERRRLDARDQLRHAHELFGHFGMEGFAERARAELEATGERARKRTAETRDDLTPREAQISRLAAEGATNPEIAAQLFISASTVDYHLRKTFRKLGVKSRYQLKEQLLELWASVH